MANRLKAKDITLEVTDEARKSIITLGADETFGARPMKRHIQRTIETMVAKKIIENPNIEGHTLVVDADENGYVVSVKQSMA